jgi:selenocysteine-specific elongation factor
MKRQELKSKLPADFSPVLYDRLLEDLLADVAIALENERVRLAGHTPELDEAEKALAARIERIYDETGFNSPALKELQGELADANAKRLEKVLTALFDQARIVEVGEGVVLGRRFVQAAETKLREHFAHHDQLTASEFRQLINTSRKYAIPLLNYFDSRGVTQRMGEVRVLRKKV